LTPPPLQVVVIEILLDYRPKIPSKPTVYIGIDMRTRAMPKALTLLVSLPVVVLTHSIANARNLSSLKTARPENAIVHKVSARSDPAPMSVASTAGSEASYECGATTLHYKVEGVAISVTSGECTKNNKGVGQTASIPNR
jgi:hypothetical protein